MNVLSHEGKHNKPSEYHGHTMRDANRLAYWYAQCYTSEMQHALALYRARAGLSRKAVADAAQTTRQTIHRIERGETQPSWDLAARLIRVSGGWLSADDFLRHRASRREAAE